MCTNPKLIRMEVQGMNPDRLSSEMGYGSFKLHHNICLTTTENHRNPQSG